MDSSLSCMSNYELPNHFISPQKWEQHQQRACAIFDAAFLNVPYYLQHGAQQQSTCFHYLQRSNHNISSLAQNFQLFATSAEQSFVSSSKKNSNYFGLFTICNFYRKILKLSSSFHKSVLRFLTRYRSLKESH